MYLGFDLGTTNVKAVVVDRQRRVVASASAPVDRFVTPDGGVEQDIEQIWDAVCNVVRQIANSLNVETIQSVGVSSQGGAMQLLDARERPLGRVISWLDGRGGPFDRRITRELGESYLAEHIGSAASMVAIGQLLRLQAEAPNRLAAARYIGFVGDVIVGRLCGHRAHDPTTLSIAMLYNPWLGRADPEILVRLRISEEQLPDLLPATTPAGGIDAEASRRTGLREGIPVSPAIHDQYAVSLGAGAVHDGDVTFSAGTAWVLLANSTRLMRPVAKNTFVCAHPVLGLFGQMISMINGGSAIQWVLNLLDRDDVSADALDRELESSPPGADGLCFWPLLATHVDAYDASDHAKTGGRISGITLAHGPSHLVRAVVEGLACELTRHLKLLAGAGCPVQRLTMCGAAAASRQTPQIVADMTGLPVVCIEAFDTSALGAAVVAQTLVEKDADLAQLAGECPPIKETFLPATERSCYRGLLERYMQPFTVADTHLQDIRHPERSEG
jgi:xylulokinase